MPRTSYRDMLADWQKLEAAVRGNEPDLPILIPYRMELDTHIEEVQAAKVRQTLLELDRELATLELRKEINAGRDHVIRLRSQIRAALGPRDQRLRDFGIAPIGKRPRKPAQEDPHDV